MKSYTTIKFKNSTYIHPRNNSKEHVKREKDMKKNSSSIYKISIMYNTSQNNLKASLRKVHYQQQTRLLET